MRGSTSVLSAGLGKAIVVSPTRAANEGDILPRVSPISSKKNSVRRISRNWQVAQVFPNCRHSSVSHQIRQPGPRQIDASRTRLKLSRSERYIACDQFDRADRKQNWARKNSAAISCRAIALLRLKRRGFVPKVENFASQTPPMNQTSDRVQFHSAVCCVSFGNKSISRRMRLSPSEQSSNSSLRWRRIGACSRDSSSSA